MPDAAWVPAPWIIAIIVQLVGVVFVSGIVWNKLTGIERRLDRLDDKIGTTTSEIIGILLRDK